MRELSAYGGRFPSATFMDLRQLRYFVGIVQSGSLSRAADQLHVAQSAISHHLAGLESELDRQLVTRGPKGIQLTEAGSVLYRHAERSCGISTSLSRMRKRAQCPFRRVSIGFPVARRHLGYELLARVRRILRRSCFMSPTATAHCLRERLDNGRLDIAVLFTGQPERGLAVERLLLEELFYVTADPDPRRSDLTMSRSGRCLCRDWQRQPARRSGSVQHRLTVTPIAEIDSLPCSARLASGIGNTICHGVRFTTAIGKYR